MKTRNPKLNLLALALLPLSLAQAATTGFTQRVNVSSQGAPADFYTLAGYQASVSFDGRYAVFASDATTLVAGDTNNLRDIFVHDNLTGKTERVSVAANGVQAEQTCRNYYDGSNDSTISADGRYVAFASSATNLVSNDTNCMPDVFVRDLVARKTYLVSVAADGGGSNDWSGVPSLSADGRYVAFWAPASNLVAGDDNGFQDAFVRDRQTGKTKLVSVSSSGAQGNSHAGTPTITADGRYVAFGSNSSNLVPLDINNTGDIFLRDLKSNKTTLVSANPARFVGNGLSFRNDGDWWNYRPALSADGRYVAFTSYASDLAGGDTNGVREVFVRDTKTNSTSRASFDSFGQQANGDSARPALSADGRVVSFTSAASNLDPWNYNGRYQIFTRDRVAGVTVLASQSSDGDLGNNDTFSSAVSADGRYTVFESYADNLIFSDTNGQQDIFIRDGVIDSRQFADVSLSQSASANPVKKGQQFSYTVTINNKGGNAAANASLVDVPPAQGALVSVKPSRGSSVHDKK